MTALAFPFQVGAVDLETVEGVGEIGACLKQIIGTRATWAGQLGELPWRPAAGSPIPTIRHRKNTADTRSQVVGHIKRAAAMWEPRAATVEVETFLPAVGRETFMEFRVRYSDGATPDSTLDGVLDLEQ